MTDRKPSKSEKKRQFHALQELGEQLIGLPDDQLATIDTDAYLIEQVLEAKKISAHGALRRQKQLIGKIMRQVDPEPLKEALSRYNLDDERQKALFRSAELWRDRICTEGPAALDAFTDTCDCSTSNLNGLHEQYTRTADEDYRRQLSRKIFREIHQIMSLEMQNSGR